MNRLHFKLVFIQYFGFFSIGVVMSVIGPLIPYIRDDLGLSYGLAGILFPAQSVGALVSLFLSGSLIHVFGKRKLLAVGSVVFIAGLVTASLAVGLPVLVIGMFLIGAAVGFFDAGINTLCLDSHPDGKGKALNRLHFFFGAGAVIGPLITFAVEKLAADWRWVFALCTAGPAVVFIFLLVTRLPPSPPAEPKRRFAVYKRPLLWLAALALCFYCGVEWGVGAWFPSYWNNTPFADILHPAFATSLFWLTFTAGRFFAGTRADRWGFRRFLSVSFAATLALAALWFWLRDPAFALPIVLLLGFSIAGQYPTLVALAARKFPASSGQVASFLSVFAVAGSSLFPFGVGVWADASGIGALVGAELILTLGMILFGLLAFGADRRQANL